MKTSSSTAQSDESVFWHLVELMMNVSNNLFTPSQGVEDGTSYWVIDFRN